METPITFDIYTKATPENKSELEAYMRIHFPLRSTLEIKKEILKSINTNDDLVCLKQDMTWSEVLEIRAHKEQWTKYLKCTQHMAATDGYCEKHDLYFGGIFDCHVCTGFYKK